AHRRGRHPGGEFRGPGSEPRAGASGRPPDRSRREARRPVAAPGLCRGGVLRLLRLPQEGRWDVQTVQTLVNALVVAFATAILGWIVAGSRREMRESVQQLRADLRDAIAALRVEMREEIRGLRVEVREEIAALRVEVREEIRGLRSDLTQVALAVGIRPRAQNG